MNIAVGVRFLARTTEGHSVMLTIKAVDVNDCMGKWAVIDRIRLGSPESAVEYRTSLENLTPQMKDWTEIEVGKG